MSSAPEDVAPRAGEICIDASQLRPGVHVRLPVPWLEHQFLLSSFVIADEEQARQIAAMKLPQIFCDPARCRVQPLPQQEAATTPSEPNPVEDADQSALRAARMAEKLERSRAMNAVRDDLRKRMDATQRHYVGVSGTVKNAMKSLAANPTEAVRQLAAVSEESVAALLSDPDSAIVLISKRAQNDGHAAHALSVMTLALLLGKQARLPETALRTLGTGALLHDVGKLTINPSILRNAARNRHEETIYQTHCRRGYDEAVRAGNVSKVVLDIILHHHERADGSGFPDRLAGDAIPLAARMVAIADRFDSLASPVDYRPAMSPSEVLSTLWAREQKALDAGWLQRFVRAMGVYPPGSVVQLSDDRVAAVVASAPSGKPLSPRVMIYAPEVPRSQSIIIDLATESDLKIERALRLRDRPDEEIEYLLPRRNVSWSYMPEQP